jgi:hypothetical protein
VVNVLGVEVEGEGEEKALEPMGELNVLDPSLLEEGGGMMLLIGGGKEGVIGFAPRARAADVIGLGVVGSD